MLVSRPVRLTSMPGISMTVTKARYSSAARYTLCFLVTSLAAVVKQAKIRRSSDARAAEVLGPGSGDAEATGATGSVSKVAEVGSA
jgi:hypothetical protein